MKNLALLLLLSCLSCATTKNLDTASERAKIIQVCQKQVDAWRLQSVEQESEVWAHVPYAMQMLTNGTKREGWENLEKNYTQAFANSDISADAFKTELNDFWVHISGKTAWVIFDQHQIFPSTVANRNDLYESLQLRILEHINGEWRIVLQLTGPYQQEEN